MSGARSVLSFILFFWILAVCLSAAAVQGQVQVIGSSRSITAVPGGDVVLPCRSDPEMNVEALTVEWSRTDLKPDPSDRLKRLLYVHIYRDRREDLDMKLPSFTGRTSLSSDGLRTGDISLHITNVTLSDNGTYRCFIPNLRSRSREAFVSLIVDPNVAAVIPTEDTPLLHKNPEHTDLGEETKDRNRWIMVSVVIMVVIVVIVIGGVLLFHPQFKNIWNKVKKHRVSNDNNIVSAENREVLLTAAEDTRIQMEREEERVT